MNDIKCPHCHQAFKIDESSYADIVVQIRNSEFEAEVNRRLELAEKDKKSALDLAKSEFQQQLIEQNAQKNDEIKDLQSKIDAIDAHHELVKAEAVRKVQTQCDALTNQLNNAQTQLESALAIAQAKSDKAKQEAVAQKDAEINALKLQLSQQEGKRTLELSQVRGKLDLVEQSHALAVQNLKESYEQKIKDREESIERLKDMKAKLSTKMVGETLELHCENQFNMLRASAFQRSTFNKDNDARTGSKGDYIFREFDENGIEVVSIMFEMKNENETTKTKTKNEHFFKELDKDRREKGCEYAVLVSLLESDSELYNSGIVDVSHHYPKMYVVRPQFFIPIITLLRNAAMNALKYKVELAQIKAQNIDISNFEDQLHTFKTGFARNYDLASRQFEDAIKHIDKSIDHLQKTKESLLKSINNLRLANNKAQDVSIKKLTRKNPTMKELFDSARMSQSDDSD